MPAINNFDSSDAGNFCHLMVFYIFALFAGSLHLFVFRKLEELGKLAGQGKFQGLMKDLALSFSTSIFLGGGEGRERKVTIIIDHFPSCLFFFQDRTEKYTHLIVCCPV